jgi:NDP-sugar pyrophosphorylase family protein
MILAAGHATRLRPLSTDVAKAVVPFLNRPLLDHTLEWLARSGFQRVVINLHHAGDTIARRYGTRAFGLAVTYSHEPELLGTAGGPRRALDQLGDEILLVNGDVVGLLAVGELYRHHRASGAMATLALYRGDTAAGYPHVTAARSGELLAFPGATDATAPPDVVRGVFTGLHIVRREVLELVPPGQPAGIVDTLYTRLMASGLPVQALPVTGAWYEVGDPQRYIDNQLRSLRLADVPLGIVDYQRVVAGGYRSPDLHLENARLVPPYLAGAGARVRHGASLEAVVIGDRARIGGGARLERVVAWEDSWIGPGCDLRDVVVMRGAHVPSGTCATNTVFTSSGSQTFGAPAAAAS